MMTTEHRATIVVAALCVLALHPWILHAAQFESRGVRTADATTICGTWGGDAGSGKAVVDATVTLSTIRSVAARHVPHDGAAAEVGLDGLADAIYRESLAAEVDPLMIAAIVARESSFRPGAVSHAGAVGLMQLRPFVAREVAERTNIAWEGEQTLRHPEQNLRLGIRYYQELVRRFDGDVRLALAAYNRGPSHVSSQLRAGHTVNSRYAQKVLDLYRELNDQMRGT